MPETGKAGALTLAERLRAALSAKPLETHGHSGVTVTGSFGVATYPQDATTAVTLLEVADRAMYLAKARGRNAVACADELGSDTERDGPGSGPPAAP
jgi:diguanylate cyclase (GGDEF)-like protein